MRTDQTGPVEGTVIRVRGLVQGVGFRPTVWRLANDLGLSGEVFNDGSGVLIRAWGRGEALRGFVEKLETNAPPLARIDAIETKPLRGEAPRPGLHIVDSEQGAVLTGIVPDAATCPACLADIVDPDNRRHRYPFTNCTHCGPRLSIVKAIPYDRANTAMASFDLCEACAAEYANPADRRFHAQPNACPECGPRLWLEDDTGAAMAGQDGTDAVERACTLIEDGAIIAIKGIGGFHLACDATDMAAVARLRKRKRRFDKPFALMARDADTIRRYVQVSVREEAALSDAAAPIVVLERRPDCPQLPTEIAPGQTGLGFILPYSPLHHLLTRRLDRPIVLTSGNRSDEPQCVANEDARKRLRDIADAWLMHDRDIVNRLDDSVVRVAAGATRVIRRARGYTPAPIGLPDGFESASGVLAMGGELKNTFCLIKDGLATLSPHIGDLEDPSTHRDYRHALSLFRRIYDFDPTTVAVDGHPDYLSTQWGQALAEETGADIAEVQHHHAHIAACLAEHGVPLGAPRVLGIALDGLGYGADGSLWGGEFLAAGYADFDRLARFAPVPLLGGEQAMREPWRNAYSHLCQFLGWKNVRKRWPDLPIVDFLAGKPLATLDAMVRQGVNAPPASSAGRLFDAAAASIGLCRESTTYEGQAAIELEALAATVPDVVEGYGCDLTDDTPRTLGWAPLWRGVLDDLAGGTRAAVVSARFHQTVIDAVSETALGLCRQGGLKKAVLSGGVFQNRILLEGVTSALERHGLDVLSPRQVPANDGGLSLGQAAIAAARHVTALRE